MLQLINSLPFEDFDVEKLRKDWTRFQDGLVALSECPNAIREEFDCEASIIQYNENDEVSSTCTLPVGTGRLILTVTKIYWINSVESLGGWSVNYQNVILHAISKPGDRPYIYLQINYDKIYDVNGDEIENLKSERIISPDGVIEEESENDNYNDDDDDDDEEKFVEVHLYVKDELIADELFLALSECSALHPTTTETEELSGEEEEEEPEKGEPEKKINRIDLDRFEDAGEN